MPPPTRAARLGEAEICVEETGEAFAGRRRLLRLLRDGIERERSIEREPLEATSHSAHGQPRPREAERSDQTDPRGERQPGEAAAGDRRTEAGAGDTRVLGVVPLPFRGKPERGQ